MGKALVFNDIVVENPLKKVTFEPMVPKAGFTIHRSRYGKGGSL